MTTKISGANIVSSLMTPWTPFIKVKDPRHVVQHLAELVRI